MKVDEPSVPIIDVGGNFTQGNISGQSAIGNNISQILYKDCTFVYPDGSTKRGHSWINTQGSKPDINPEKIFGREKELENIEDLLKDKSALVIMGFCGTGKFTLASMYVDRIQYFTNWIRKSSSFIPISKYFSVKHRFSSSVYVP